MSAGRARLRLEQGALAGPVEVLAGELPGDARLEALARAGTVLVLVSPLSVGAGQTPHTETLAAVASGRVLVHEQRLLGIGARYVTGVARHAASQGWSVDELLALVDALERRTVSFVAAPTLHALEPLGLVRSRRAPRRVRAARHADDRWAEVPPGEVAAAARRARLVRGAVCLVATSGGAAPAAALGGMDAAEASAHMPAGLARALRLPWAVETLVAPRLPAGSLVALRDQLAAMPRCAWCRAPMLLARCPRCGPEAQR